MARAIWKGQGASVWRHLRSRGDTDNSVGRSTDCLFQLGWRVGRDLGSKAAARDAGKLRIEGKEYEVQDGDVVEFRFNV